MESPLRPYGRRSSELLDQSIGWTRRDRHEAVFLLVLYEDQEMTFGGLPKLVDSVEKGGSCDAETSMIQSV
jgi:hypothetical protein